MAMTIEQKREYHREYKKKNSKRINEYVEKNKDKVRQYHKEYQRTHRVEQREYMRLRRLENPHEYEIWRKNNKDRRNETARIWRRKIKEGLAGRPKPTTCEIFGCYGTGKIYFDHCHKTGKFRGWICGHCNTAIGMSKDNPNILRSQATYLENFNGANTLPDSTRVCKTT